MKEREREGIMRTAGEQIPREKPTTNKTLKTNSKQCLLNIEKTNNFKNKQTNQNNEDGRRADPQGETNQK